MEKPDNYCGNCKREIEVNYELHILHCKKNLFLCDLCKEPVLINEKADHLITMHTIEICDFCTKPFEKWKLEEHMKNCTRKPVMCKFCNKDLPGDYFDEHAKICWSKTEKCQICSQYVQRKDKEQHEKICGNYKKEPVMCKFCNLDCPADDFKEHAEMCWNRTEKCPRCSQFIRLKDQENHEKICRNPSMRGYVACKFCEEQFPSHIIETHEFACGEKNGRCPDCGELIKKYKNNHECKRKKDSNSVSILRCISCDKKYPSTMLATHIKDCHVKNNHGDSSNVGTRSGNVNGHKKEDISSRPSFNGAYNSPNSRQIEPVRNPAVEISPPVQKDFSDKKYNRLVTGKNSNRIQCQICCEFLVPEEVRIHSEVCPLRPKLCQFCKNSVPFNVHHPDLHHCHGILMSQDNPKYGLSATDEYRRPDNYPANPSSNLSKEDFSVTTRNCPLCSKTFPLDRLDDHVRACAGGKEHCHLCKKDYYGGFEDHFKVCPIRSPKKGKKKNQEKQEGLYQRGMNFFGLGRNKEKKSYGKPKPDVNPEYQFAIDGIPCEFCEELFPFEEIAVHELCMHEEEMKERDKKKTNSEKKPKDEIPQASGYTRFDPSKYMPMESYENKDREDRNQRHSKKSPNERPSKSFSPKSNQRNFYYDQSKADQEDFYEKHLIKDHEKDSSARKYKEEPRKAVEEVKKKTDVLFTYSSEKKSKFLVEEEKNIDQGVRPKYQTGGNQRENYLCYKVLNRYSSDEETELPQSKDPNPETERVVRMAVDPSDHKLRAIGHERKDNKTTYELENNGSGISIGNDKISKSSSQDVSSHVTKKKGSFNSDSSEEVYLSCDEGEEETRPSNRHAKISNKDRVDKKLENRSTGKKVLPAEAPLEKFGLTIDELEKYVKDYRNFTLSKNGGNGEEKLEKGSTENGLQEQEITLNDFDKYSNLSESSAHHLNPIDSITLSSSAISSPQETKSLQNDFVMDDVDMESEADKKNEETFASDSRVNPFEAMTNGRFSYDTASSLPPYSSLDLGFADHGAVDVKNEDNLDTYFQFLGVSAPEPVSNYRLFGSHQACEAQTTDSSIRYFTNVESDAVSSGNLEHKMEVSVPQEPCVEAEELKGVSKNMTTYTSPFLLENDCEEVESVPYTLRKLPVPLEEEKMEQISGRLGDEKKVKSQEERDNEMNLRSWRSYHQVGSESDE